MKYIKRFLVIVMFLGAAPGVFSQEKTFGFGFHAEVFNQVDFLTDFQAGAPLGSIEFAWRLSPDFSLIFPVGYTRTESTTPNTYVHLLEAGVVGLYYFNSLLPDALTPMVQVGLSVLGIHDSLAFPYVAFKEYAVRADLALGVEYLFSSHFSLFSTFGLQMTYFVAPVIKGTKPAFVNDQGRGIISTMVQVGARLYLW